jgi:hypothetical protein
MRRPNYRLAVVELALFGTEEILPCPSEALFLQERVASELVKLGHCTADRVGIGNV